MTISQLKQYLQTLPVEYDKCRLVTPGADHSYIDAQASLIVAEQHKTGHLSEYFDDTNMDSTSKKIHVLVVE